MTADETDTGRSQPGASGTRGRSRRSLWRLLLLLRRPRKHGAAGRFRRRRRLVSPLTARILMVNVIALLIPVGGLLYLGPYRDGLVDADLEGLRTQAEIMAGAIGEGAIVITPTGRQHVELGTARHIVRRLSGPTRVRARLFLPTGELAADSRFMPGGHGSVEVRELPAPEPSPPLIDRILGPIDWLGDLLAEQANYKLYRERPVQRAEDYPEIERAMAGEITGQVRRVATGEDSRLVLSVAVPVQRYRQVMGALMLSHDSREIEAAVRTVRRAVLAVFAGALVVTVLLSFYLASAIARPIRRLAAAAERVRRGIGRETQRIPDFTDRGDEIGDLSGVLREMTDALHSRLEAIERFAADVSHEIKNPLTSLRSAVETAARVKDPTQQAQLMGIILEDVQRLDRLISDISDASRLDAELSRAETAAVAVAEMLQALADLYGTQAGAPEGPHIHLELPEDRDDLRIPGMEDRMVQVFRNLIGNAISFSPPGGTIRISAWRVDEHIEIAVEDQGPGIPENKLEAIFDRFYTERPKGEKFGTHSGLGLSISKQIVEAHGGTIRAENVLGPDGSIAGARFTVELPRA